MRRLIGSAIFTIMLFANNSPADSRPAEEDDKKLFSVDQETRDKVCSDKNPNLITEYSLPGEPSFWVKPFVYEGNQDPVSSFDNKVMTVLKGNAGKFALDFYSPTGKGTLKLKKHESSLKIFGAYQSIAPLKSENGITTYRLLLDRYENGGQGTTAPSILEFELTKGNQVKIKSEFKDLCPGKKLQTPFLSKDGKMFAALNLETQTTQIFDIASGECLLKEDIGFITGKADFNAEGTKIVFHLTGVEPAAKAGWIRSIKSENWSNVYTYELGKKKSPPSLKM